MSNALFPNLHDSSLDAFGVSVTHGSCVVRLAGVTGDLPNSACVEISCSQLNSLFLVIDGEEICDNAWPGNVQDGRIEAADHSEVFRLYLAGGMLEVGGIFTSHIVPRHVDSAVSHFRPSEAVKPFDQQLADALHFAVLTEISHSVERKEIAIQLLAPVGDISNPLQADLPRRAATIILEEVRSCVMRLDASTVGGCGILGNVRNCLLDEERGIVWLYLRNGIIEVKAERALFAFD